MPGIPYSGLSGLASPGTIQAPDDYQRISADPSAFGAGIGAAEQNLGAKTEQLGDTGIGIATQQQAIQNRSASLDAMNSFQDFTRQQLFLPKDPNATAFYSLKGQAAVDGVNGVAKSIEDQRASIMAGLDNDAQRLTFDRQSRTYTNSVLTQMGRHTLEQRQVAQDQVSQAAVSSNTADAVSNWNDPTKFQSALAAGQTAIIDQGQRNGWDPAVTNQRLAENKSQLFGTVANTMSQTNPQMAWDFYNMHKGSMLGPDQVALEGRLRPQLLNWSSRRDADGITGGATNGAPLAPTIISQAVQQGVGASLALTAAKIESNMGQAQDRPGADPQGVFQMTADTWAARGGTPANRADPNKQIELGVANLKHSQDVASQALGRPADDWQTYMTHQQGDGGGAALLKADPSQSAVAALAPAYKGNTAQATQAITANGGNAGMTAGQFLATWQSRYAQQAASVVSTANAPAAADVRQNVAGWLDQARTLRDPFGQDNPVYQDQVASRIRARVGEIEYGQAQQERSNRETLLGAAMGMPSAATGPSQAVAPDGTAPAPGGTPASGAGLMPASTSGPAPVPPRPTSLDQMLQNPTTKAAWLASTPETQRGIMQLVEHNAHGEDPPMTPDAQGLYYQLSGMAVNDREAFQKLNLADPQYTSALPHSYWNTLAGEQRRMGTADVAGAAREATQARALSVLKPDLLGAGIKTDGLKPNTAAAQTYDQFVGRLREDLDTFQQSNNRRPNDSEIAKLGQSLLLQGSQRGTAGILPSWLGGGDRTVRSFQAEPGTFAPAVPPTDRQGIVAAYQARHNGTMPSEGQIQEVWMVGRQRAMLPSQLGLTPGAPGSQPPAGGRPTTPNPFTAGAPAAPAAAAPAAAQQGSAGPAKPDPTRAGRAPAPAPAAAPAPALRPEVQAASDEMQPFNN